MKQVKNSPSYPPGFIVFLTQGFRQRLIRLYRRFTHPNVMMWENIQQMWVASGLGVVAELGIADMLKAGPRGIEDLARESQTDASSLYRVMRMLASQGIFKETHGKMFHSTSLSRPLEDEHIRHLVMIHLSPKQFHIFGDLLSSVKKGTPVSSEETGRNLFKQLDADSERNSRFNRAMSNASLMQASAIKRSYSFERYANIIDLGGGQGIFLSALLQQNPGARGTVFDLPAVIRQTSKLLESYGLNERMEAVEGDFFEEVPEGGDLYIMKSVLHDWDDEDAFRILENTRKSMSPGARLLIIEALVGKRNKPSFGKMTDLLMMANVGGKERSREEYRVLLRKSGFRIRKIQTTITFQDLIEAVPEF